jgi:predicted transcriptional regulator
LNSQRGDERRKEHPRSRWEIILDILKVISEERGEAKKTRIMQKACLDWRNFQKHFHFLQERGFVGNSVDAEEGKSYCLTEKGRDLLKRLREVEGILR